MDNSAAMDKSTAMDNSTSMDELEIIIAESRHLSAEERRQRYFNFFVSQGQRVTLSTLGSGSSSSGSRTPIGLPSPAASDRGQPVNYQQGVMYQQNVVPPARELESTQGSRHAGPTKPTQQASPPFSAGKTGSRVSEKQRSKLVRTPGRLTRSKVNASTPFVQLDMSGKKVVKMTNPRAVTLDSCGDSPEATKTSSMSLLGSRNFDHTPQLGQGNTLKRKRGADDEEPNQTKRTRCETPSTISCIESNSLPTTLFTVEAHDGTPSRIATWFTNQEPETYEPLENNTTDYALEPCRPVEQSITTASIESSQSIRPEEEMQHMEEYGQSCHRTESSFTEVWISADQGNPPLFENTRAQTTPQIANHKVPKAVSRHKAHTLPRTTRSSATHDNKKRAKIRDYEIDIPLVSVFNEIDAYCKDIELDSNVANTAKVIYSQIHGAPVTEGKPVDALVATCILIAFGEPDVASVFERMFSLVKGPSSESVRVLKDIVRFLYPHLREDGADTRLD